MIDKSRLVLNVDGEPRAFFGRKSGKHLGGQQQKLIDTVLKSLEIVLPENAIENPQDYFDAPPQGIADKKLIMEIGYGGGEHLARLAEQSPDVNFIGCEVYTGGIGKLLTKIDQVGLSNIRLYADDALQLLQKLPDASLDGVYLLYPDPWPKSRHHKRRFVSQFTLSELARVIRPGGFFRFASDIEDYANWTLSHILRVPEFSWPIQQPGAWHKPYEGWQATRYEQKARREGRLKSFYFTFVRRSSDDQDVNSSKTPT